MLPTRSFTSFSRCRSGKCCNDGKDLGTLSQTLLRKLLERSFLRTFKNFKQGDFCSLLFVYADAECSRIPCYYFRLLRDQFRQRNWHDYRLSPLPDRNGRKLVYEWEAGWNAGAPCGLCPCRVRKRLAKRITFNRNGTTRVSFRSIHQLT